MSIETPQELRARFQREADEKQAAIPRKDRAYCRGCYAELRGRWNDPYHNVRTLDGSPVKWNYYGGFVCCYNCDRRSSLELEQSMPGHGPSQGSLGQMARQSLENNWRDEP